MREATRSKIAACMCRLVPGRIARRFVRRQDGAAAIEFGLVAAPFLALTFAILETAMVFFAGQTLETAAAESARLIMTGQAQSTDYATGAPKAGGFSQAEFKQAVCARIFALFDCANQLFVDVQKFDSFAAITRTPPIDADTKLLTNDKTHYDPGDVGNIVAVSLYYPWPIYVSLLGNDLASSNLSGSNRLLVATSVFRVEPFH